jgi:hypothetical protein
VATGPESPFPHPPLDPSILTSALSFHSWKGEPVSSCQSLASRVVVVVVVVVTVSPACQEDRRGRYWR